MTNNWQNNFEVKSHRSRSLGRKYGNLFGVYLREITLNQNQDDPFHVARFVNTEGTHLHKVSFACFSSVIFFYIGHVFLLVSFCWGYFCLISS